MCPLFRGSTVLVSFSISNSIWIQPCNLQYSKLFLLWLLPHLDVPHPSLHMPHLPLNWISSPTGVSSTTPTSAALLIPLLIDLLNSGALNEHLGRKEWKEMFSSLVALPMKLLLTTAGGRWSSSECWKRLATELLKAKKADHTRSLSPSLPCPLLSIVPSISLFSTHPFVITYLVVTLKPRVDKGEAATTY